MKNEKTKTVFRVFPQGDVIALFPTEVAESNPGTCSSYQHIGQHGAALPQALVPITRLARPSEYRALASELRRAGYRLDIRSRITAHDYQARKNALGIND